MNISLTISKYIIYCIFLVVPLIFSHIFLSIGYDFVITEKLNFLINNIIYFFLGVEQYNLFHNGYEHMKSYIFSIMIFLSLIFFLIGIFFENNKNFNRNKNILYFVGAYFLIILISNLFSVDLFTSIMGGEDKAHGTIMYIAIGFLFIQTYYLFSRDDFKVVFWIVVTGLIFIFLLGIAEYTGLTPLLELYSIDKGIVSTFGNSNYLAGYILIIIPLLFYFIKNYYIIAAFLILSFLFLLLTKSIAAIGLFLVYLISLITLRFKDFVYKYKYTFGIVFLMTLSGLIFSFKYNYHIFEKSLESRFYLWTMFPDIMLSSLKKLVFGRGLDTFLEVFEYYKPSELYSQYNADRFHNVFMDWFYWFGIFGVYFVYVFGYHIYKFFRNRLSHVLILFLLFFSLNIYTVSHLLIVIFVISFLAKFGKLKNI